MNCWNVEGTERWEYNYLRGRKWHMVKYFKLCLDADAVIVAGFIFLKNWF